MRHYSLPYGLGQLSFRLPTGLAADVVEPAELVAADDPLGIVGAVLDSPVGGANWANWPEATSAAIAINDKTRPVPNEHLLPPLLQRLEALGLPPDAITLVIATGAHSPMPPEEFSRVVPGDCSANPARSTPRLGTC